MKFSYNASNQSASGMVKNPGKLLGKNQSLVFTYPVLCDKSVVKYQNMIRDFMTTQYIAEIKTSNVLNIAGEASRAGSIESESGYVNPAEKLLNTVGSDRKTQSEVLDKINTRNIQQQTKEDYERKMMEFSDFIVDQVKNDPKYSDLRPVISSITVENLLTIPLIVGTKSYKLDTNFTYWFLYAAFGLEAPLDSKLKFGNIASLMNEIPADKYKELIYQASKHRVSSMDLKVNSPKQVSAMPQTALNNLMNDSQNKLRKNLKTIERVLNENMWNEEVGVNNDDLNISTVAIEKEHAMRQAGQNAISLFANIYSSDIVRLFQSFANVLVGVNETDIPARLDALSGDVIRSTNNLITNLGNNINQSIQKSSDEENLDYGSKLEKVMAMASSSCENVSKIDPSNIYSSTRNIYFRIGSATGDELLNFVEDLNGVSNQVTPLIEQLVNLITNMSPGTESAVVNNISSYRNNVKARITNFIYGNNDPSGSKPIIDKSILDSINNDGDLNNKEFSPKFAELIGLTDPNSSDENKRYIKKHGKFKYYKRNVLNFSENLISIGEILITFTALYTFLSYYCEYVNEIEASVKAKRKDALGFPNYCLVVPSFFIERIYIAAAAKKFEMDLEETRLGHLAEANVNENNIAKMINYLNKHLKIPNLVVIDLKSENVYYKWMYMPAAMQTSMSSIKNYVSHQSQVLPGF